MILDEAQNIKNSASARWKTLLGFHCRNRLLLTGTPVQNSMQGTPNVPLPRYCSDSRPELWALLHFIMPSLFDSHDEFNEWFSKDIENAAENKGSKLNEHQLRRLHMILKPFMLRRVKRHVQNELSDKVGQSCVANISITDSSSQIEKDIYVDLGTRQRKLYRALLANVSVADLLAQAANIGDADSARSLMNLVMQFRKVSSKSWVRQSGADSCSLGVQPSRVIRTCRRHRLVLFLSFWSIRTTLARRRFCFSALFDAKPDRISDPRHVLSRGWSFGRAIGGHHAAR
jgi:SNF2 family DNA or RNA helicase